MVVKFFFKRVVPSFFLYYGGLQAYLVFHLYSSPGGVREPKLPPIITQESRKTLVENVLSIYQCSATSGSFATFTDDVQFEDGMVLIKGKDNYKNLAFMMRASLQSSETLSVKEHHYEDQFILELHQKYGLLGMEIKMPSVIYVDLEGEAENQKVKYVTEEWFGKALITPENTPFLYTGVTSRFFRNVHGKLCDMIRFDEPK